MDSPILARDRDEGDSPGLLRLVIVRESEVLGLVRNLRRHRKTFARMPVVVSEFDGHTVFHVHLRPLDGRIAGNPETGLLIASGAAEDELKRPRLLQEALECRRSHGSGFASFLATICTFADDASGFEVRSSWYSPSFGEFTACETLIVQSLGRTVFSLADGATDILVNKHAVLIGVGELGSACAVELARRGVGRISLFDSGRLEAGDIPGHACGFSSLGRFRTRAVRDLILDRNPGCRVETHERQFTTSDRSLMALLGGPISPSWP